MHREVCRFVPNEFEAWRLCAELQLKLPKPDGAFEAFIESRTHFGQSQTRGEAIALQRRARKIEPWSTELAPPALPRRGRLVIA